MLPSHRRSLARTSSCDASRIYAMTAAMTDAMALKRCLTS